MTNPLAACILVGLGGFAGSVARYGLSLASQRLAVTWPLGTFAANVLGCLAIGVIMELSARGEAVTPEARLALATGFCGGFTTMSSMVYETTQLLRDGEYLHSAAYVAGTLLASVAAFFAGVAVVRVLVKIGGGLWN